jgi:site-specific recombinase XerD
MTEGSSESARQSTFLGPGLAALTASTSWADAAAAFELYLTNQEYSEHTIRSFRSDLRLAGQYLGTDTSIGRVTTSDLNRFLNYLLHERDVPCSPKSYARRVTTLKVFFKWLHRGGVLPEDVAEPVIQRSVPAPLPEILTDDEIARARAVTLALWQAQKPDPRPHLLLNLLLATAMKKAECMGIRLRHIQRDAPGSAYVQIRYDNPARKLKERKLDMPADLLPVLDDYLEQYKPQDALFPCTPRNLEYVLSNVAERADIHKRAKKGISFEMLRWTAAALDYRAGVDPTHLRQKLGVSEVTWQDTEKKTRKEQDQ